MAKMHEIFILFTRLSQKNFHLPSLCDKSKSHLKSSGNRTDRNSLGRSNKIIAKLNRPVPVDRKIGRHGQRSVFRIRFGIFDVWPNYVCMSFSAC